ncbi:general transcription factor 3C polypeptide 1 [Rhinophrynus dorsalis]
MDLLEAVVDEVALEGLDGITLSALWLRLQTRVPTFPLLLDSATKQLIWQSLVSHPEIDFYQLPVERRPLVISNRYEESDVDPLMLKDKNISCPEDIYPVYIVSENKNNIQGSCQFFKERILLTDQIKPQACTYEEALDRWGEKLVIVGSQVLRYRALIGWEGDPALKLPDCSYCILEKLGRSRWQGALQKDLQGSFKVDAGKTHYLRRVLDRNGLITMQSHVVRLSNRTQQHSLLLLLKRFHVDRRNKYDMLSEKVSALLSECPNQMETLVNLREQLCVPEQVFKRMYHYMASAGVLKIISLPLHELQPLAERIKTKRGTDIMIRCVKLMKEYKRKMDDSDDEEDDVKSPIVPVDIICEKDMLTQTYELIENRGTKGVSQSEIRMSMNVGKLEARMLCRLLERCMLIKGFMEDEGRQRTTKFISHVFVEESDLRRQFLEEKAKSEKLSMFNLTCVQNVEEKAMSPTGNMSVEEEIQNSEEGESTSCKKKLKKTKKGAFSRRLSATTSTPISTPKGKSRIHAIRSLSGDTDQRSVVSENDCSLDSFQFESNISTLSTQSADEDEDDVSIIEEFLDKTTEKMKARKSSKKGMIERSHETYRLLRRRNLIVETVKNLRLVESLFTLQKMIMEQEKQEGVSTRCCKKSILRLVHKLSREGLVRLYRTTVVQDGISKKVELVVHPSINPSDPLVKSAIEQIRFRISNSTTGNRTRSPQGQVITSKVDTDDQSKDRTKETTPNASLNDSASKGLKKTEEKMGVSPLRNYHPMTVPGLGRTRGYLPKMPRLKVTHIFLWYIVYGHHLHKVPQDQILNRKASSIHSTEEHQDKAESAVSDSFCNAEVNPESQSLDVEGHFPDPTIEQIPATVYVDEESWKRYVPPSTVHGEFGPGWVLISDILLCLPLSIFIQIVQVSYQVENLEEFLNDPLKKHTLIRYLPRPIRQRLLYKRRYVFSMFQGLQKLSCMGLVQFGPSEKFQDKDQVFVYVKKKAMIVDTTACDPHYNIAQGSDPFEKRFYNFETLQNVENFWFDLQFVCLNTPLGVVRSREKKMNPQNESVLVQDIDTEQDDRQILERKYGILESIQGSREVIDDGSVPGDGLGAGGLDSSFYSHLKRNWIWISYIINTAKTDKCEHDSNITLRLQTFLTRHTLPFISGDNQKSIFGETHLTGSGEIVKVAKESSAEHNQRVCGGKGLKRKRLRKDTGKRRKAKKKKSETTDKRKKTQYHDEADQSALQRMTRLRVAWTAKEDGLIMLCRIASNLLNRKVKGPFVPWQVVRDIMHSNLEESLDKTSRSIGRRARYTIKNPQTYMNYKVCLAEVYQDKVLIEDFMSRKDNYEDPKVCAAEFKEFVERLKQKFSTALGEPVCEMPDTALELFERYRILAVFDESNEEQKPEIIESVDDIHILVLQNLIMSTLALSDMQMKSCRSLQTFRMYRTFCDDILVKAFLEFQNKRLVNRRRGNHTLGPKKNRALPFVPMSFQLSQAYYRLFIWRFPSTTCTESFQFLEMLKPYGNEDRADVFSFGDQDNEVATDMLVYPLDGPGGQCVTALSLLLVGFVSVNVKIPDQIVVVDSTLVENEVVKGIGKEVLDDEDFDEDVDETLGQKRKIEVTARQASHTNYLLMRGYTAPGIVSMRNLNPNDNIVVNSCQVRMKLRNTPVSGRLKEPGGFISLFTEVPSLPHYFTGLLNTKPLSFNQFQNQCMECLGYSPKDVSCAMEILTAVEAFSFRGLKMSDIGKIFYKYEEVDIGRTKCLEQYIQDLLTYRQVLQVGGVSLRLVAMKHASPWVLHSECLKDQITQETTSVVKDPECTDPAQPAIQDQANCKEGNSETPQTKGLSESSNCVNQTDLVSKNDYMTADENPFSRKMGTGENIETLHERESDCCFLGRPWRIVDGSLNKPVCKGMLEAVLYHIMTKPGITETDLLQHYAGVLQPVVIKELVQVLEHIGCISKRYVERLPRASLFSRTVVPQLMKNPKLVEDPVVFYEPTIDCTLRLGGIFPSDVNWNKWIL